MRIQIASILTLLLLFSFESCEKDVINLAASEEWIFETVSRDTTEIDGQISISEITRTDRITNFGILKKSDIIPWEW